MKTQGVIRGSNIVLKKSPSKAFREGEKVEVIILPVTKGRHRFSTFKLGVKKEHLKREAIYAKD
ncbi:MAG: hypothetical protein ACOYW7_11480 [Nitrospirota bacterium]